MGFFWHGFKAAWPLEQADCGGPVEIAPEADRGLACIRDPHRYVAPGWFL
jgi:hypothetical protein